jgi:hypothetical protein
MTNLVSIFLGLFPVRFRLVSLLCEREGRFVSSSFPAYLVRFQFPCLYRGNGKRSKFSPFPRDRVGGNRQTPCPVFRGSEGLRIIQPAGGGGVPSAPGGVG